MVARAGPDAADQHALTAPSVDSCGQHALTAPSVDSRGQHALTAPSADSRGQLGLGPFEPWVASAPASRGPLGALRVADRWRAAALGLQRVEWLLLGAAAPLLLFPGRYVGLGVAAIAATWLARRVGSGRWGIRTRADGSVILLGVTSLAALVPSTRLDFSAPKFWGLVLGLAAFYAVVNTCRGERSLRLAETGLLATGAGIAALGLVGMATPPDKVIDDRGIYAALPRLLTSVQSSTVATQGINPNELAGVLVLLVPLAFVLIRCGGRLRLPAAVATVMMTVAVVLSQSRAALLGLLVCGCVGTAAAFGRRGLVTVVVLLMVGIQALVQVDGLDHLRLQMLGDAPSAGVESLSGRVELWQRGLAMAVDMPFTGIGLNTFPVVLQTFYVTILHPQSTGLPHVHDLYLQTLLDFGIFGLLAWLAIVTLSIRGGLAAVRAHANRPLACALLLGILAHAVYSLVDAVTLGAKPGVVLWVVLGLLVALGQRVPQPAPPGLRPRRARGRRLRWAGAAAAAIVLAPVLLAAASLNAAVLVLHSSSRVDAAWLDADLQVGRTLAVGPFVPRFDAATALLARRRRDTSAELAALTRAQALGNWDPSLGLRLGDLRLATGDRPGAVDAWRAAEALPSLLDHAAVAPGDEALQWYTLAQLVAPADWRPYAGAARVLETQDPNRAANFLSEALRARGETPARAAIARRLVDASAQLADGASVSPSSVDADLLLRAAQLLLTRGDYSGAVLAAQLGTQAAPASRNAWLTFADVLDRVGRSSQAEAARGHAATLS